MDARVHFSVYNVMHCENGFFKDPPFLNYSPVKRVEEAAQEVVEMYAAKGKSIRVALHWTDYNPLAEEFNVELRVCEDGLNWRYVGDILFSRNFYEKDDRIYETHEIAEHPKDSSETMMYIFGHFKSVKSAVRDLLLKGNHTHDRRKGKERISSKWGE